MPKVQQIQSAFTGGEISPRLLARTDLDRYKQGVKRMENAYTLPHGGATRRAGTHYIDELRNSAVPARLIPYTFSDELSYVLTLNDGYIQFLKEKEFIVTGGTTRYEITHPYADSELDAITFAQQGSTIFLCHQNHAPKQLVRTSDTSWTLSDISFNYYALTDQDYVSEYINFRVVSGTTAFDTTSSFSITTDGAGAVTAGPTLTGTGNGTITTIEVDANLDVAGTYTIACIKSEGTGSSLRQEWTVVRNADTLTPIAKWKPNNYPAAVSFYEQRLFLGGTPIHTQTVWASKINNIEDLTLGPNDDDAIEATINSNSFNQIRHLVSARQLIILTQSEEFTLNGSDTNGLSQYTVRVSANTSHGSNTARPVKIGSEVLFVQRDGKKVRAMSYDAVTETNTSPDISIVAESITASGIKDTAYAAIPDQIMWSVRNDGALLSLTHLRNEDVTAWARHTTGTTDSFENVAVIPENNDDIVYLVVQRTINGSTVRYVEYFDYVNQTNTVGKVATDSCLVLTGTAQTVWTGLDHLESETVQVVADGKVHPDVTVASGQVTLQYAADEVQVGIGYESELQLLNPEPLIDRGTTTRLGRSRVQELSLYFQDTVNAQLIFNDKDGNEIRTENVLFFNFGDAMDSPITPYTGTITKRGQGWNDQSFYTIKQVTPMPFTVLGVDMLVMFNEK